MKKEENHFEDTEKEMKKSSIKLITLNIAHARKSTAQQLLRRIKKIYKNLDEIAIVLNRENADIVALQEADSSSRWSGHFDHVEYLAKKSNYKHIMQGEHVKRQFITYGTAIISNFHLKSSRSFKFYKTPLRLPKGFVISTIVCPSVSANIDVVSLHLDPIRKSIRMKQIHELVEMLKDDTNPIVIMGDFNCDWKYKESTLHKLVELLNLRIYKPSDENLITFPNHKKRYDWVLISQELEYLSHKIVDDHVSDHLAVVVEIGWRGGGKK